MVRILLLLLILVSLTGSVLSSSNHLEVLQQPPNATKELGRHGKFVSLFTVVRFQNEMCAASNGYNGTCLTTAECSSDGGTASGNCASGFGVCCVFVTTSCSKTSSRNCTYWQNPGGSSTTYNSVGQCNLFVKKCSPNICQIRLDFISFTLAQPDGVNGVCSTDIFTVVSGASNPVPVICGDNTGQHMYLDMTPNTDVFELSVITTTTTTTRSWNIKASQIPCTDYTSLAPSNCLQYFRESTGTISSFNYKSTTLPAVRQLANQDYTVCIRMNSGFCGICYTVCPDTLNTANAAFSISGLQTGAVGAATVVDACTSDFLQIPCATNQRSSSSLQATTVPNPTPGGAVIAAGTPANCVSQICGGIFATFTGSTVPVPVYSYRKPFELRFFTDSTEPTAADTNNIGFCLQYTQQPCVSAQTG